ncbi:hypothetical protein MTP10_21280 [Nonomuraea sp. 3-1Str]|uniref:hypothetical protein n=1 Tax=Nonomuraea sp. 3-1Str TaxID=2929801 RepID=UPI00285E6D5E|nr:hypothetical protein [Nonomuraea sp. 3-1Str]MDR8411253.1 hypothetical protein [Nonomuraea sp. 3-1Str]
MTTTDISTQPTDAERFDHIRQAQRAAYLRDGAPSPAARRSELTRFEATLSAHEEIVAQDDLPFGGVGASGVGRYHGIEGFRTLSRPKGSDVQARRNATHLLYARFGKRTAAARAWPRQHLRKEATDG